MIEFPEIKEKATYKDLKFHITDLPISFFSRIDQDSELYNDTEILRNGTTLSEDDIQSIGVRAKKAIVEKILDITNPDRHQSSEGEEGGKK